MIRRLWDEYAFETVVIGSWVCCAVGGAVGALLLFCGCGT